MNMLFLNKVVIIGSRGPATEQLGRRVLDTGYDLAGIVHDPEEVCAVVRETGPSLALLDAAMETGLGGSGLMRRLAYEYDLPVVLVSKDGRADFSENAGNMAAHGHLSWSAGDRELQGVLQTVLIRHRVEVERRNLEKQMFAAQRFEGLGFIGHRVAHDFNNILQAVIGHTQIAALDIPQASPVQGSLDHVMKAALRGAALCKQFLGYSAHAMSRPKITELSLVVRDSQGLLRTVVGKGIELEYKLAAGLPHLDVSPAVVQQMLFNLTINASEAIDQRRGKIRISTGRVWLRPHELAATVGAPERPEGEYVFLDVADDAGGISAELAVRMFEPGFTTKFSGSGMGLPAVLGLAHENGGAVTVANRLRVGAAFRVYLPVPRTQAAA